MALLSKVFIVVLLAAGKPEILMPTMVRLSKSVLEDGNTIDEWDLEIFVCFHRGSPSWPLALEIMNAATCDDGV